jgi:hypothetical protein
MKLAAIKARELPALLRTAADISEATGMSRKKLNISGS